MDKSTVYFIHALSPLHPGVGQGVGSVDLPVAREKATGIPYLPGSSVKGVLRDAAANAGWGAGKVKAIFGPDPVDASEHAGAAYFGDAKLLLLPVRSYAGVFAYATSPYLLRRFKREVEMAWGTPNGLPELPGEVDDLNVALVREGSELVTASGKESKKVYLEDLDFQAQDREVVDRWENWLAEVTQGLDLPLAGRLLILHDDVMSFLLETALEVVTRIRINEETKTVAKGALWFEENIPAESLLYGLLSVAPQSFGEVKDEEGTNGAKRLAAEEILKLLEGLLGQTLQFGGNATVGRGLSKMTFAERSGGGAS